jgi:peptidoglycan hydrolase CwlO-like protein
MGSLWDDIRKTVKEGFETVADRTDEYAKIGRLKVDIAGINHNINKLFSELGGRVYHLHSKGTPEKVTKDADVTRLVDRIKAQETKLRKKEAEIEKIKKEKDKERKKRAEETMKARAAEAEEAKAKAEPEEPAKSKPGAKAAGTPRAKRAPSRKKKTAPKGEGT